MRAEQEERHLVTRAEVFVQTSCENMNQQELPPPPMAELMGEITKSAAIIAAGQLGLFKVLAERPRSIPEIASTIGASEIGVTLLVEALASFGYLERMDDRYTNGPTACTWLTPASQIDYTPHLLWAPLMWHMMEDLSQVVRRGSPNRPLYDYLQDLPEMGRIMAQSHKANAQLNSSYIVQAVPIPDSARYLLDLGGSHGLYSIAFCRRHPKLNAVVYDLPVSVAETGKTIAAEGLAGRVSVQRGNYLTDDIGQGYDVILCFFLIHNHTEDDNKCLIAKVAKALKPGGVVVIHEFLKSEPPDAFNALYSLRFFLYSGTRNYSFQEITTWLTEVGFRDFSRIDLPPAGQTSIVTGVKIR